MEMDIERRDVSLTGRIARATWPARESYKSWRADWPCNVIGHRWHEDKVLHNRSAAARGEKMRFKCTRCFYRPGFTN